MKYTLYFQLPPLHNYILSSQSLHLAMMSVFRFYLFLNQNIEGRAKIFEPFCSLITLSENGNCEIGRRKMKPDVYQNSRGPTHAAMAPPPRRSPASPHHRQRSCSGDGNSVSSLPSSQSSVSLLGVLTVCNVCVSVCKSVLV